MEEKSWINNFWTWQENAGEWKGSSVVIMKIRRQCVAEWAAEGLGEARVAEVGRAQPRGRTAWIQVPALARGGCRTVLSWALYPSFPVCKTGQNSTWHDWVPWGVLAARYVGIFFNKGIAEGDVQGKKPKEFWFHPVGFEIRWWKSDVDCSFCFVYRFWRLCAQVIPLPLPVRPQKLSLLSLLVWIVTSTISWSSSPLTRPRLTVK